MGIVSTSSVVQGLFSTQRPTCGCWSQEKMQTAPCRPSPDWSKGGAQTSPPWWWGFSFWLLRTIKIYLWRQVKRRAVAAGWHRRTHFSSLETHVNLLSLSNSVTRAYSTWHVCKVDPCPQLKMQSASSGTCSPGSTLNNDKESHRSSK